MGRTAGLQRVSQEFDPILAPETLAVEHVFGLIPTDPTIRCKIDHRTALCFF